MLLESEFSALIGDILKLFTLTRLRLTTDWEIKSIKKYRASKIKYEKMSYVGKKKN